MRFILFAMLVTALASAQEKPAQTSDADISKVLGNWSGESICVNKEKFPACKDEVVVYHITRDAGKADTVRVSADKIVNGKSVAMGEIDFVYDVKKKTLTGEFKNERVHDSLEFVLKDDVLEGGIYSLPDRVQARRIKVKKGK